MNYSTKSLMIGGAVMALGSAAATANDSKPNIIYILADDLGYGDLGCYGQKVIKTPNIDLMAKEGMRFTDHYAGSAVCAPARCVLMTGMHTGHSDIRGNKGRSSEGNYPIKKATVTVAETLKEAGYTTGMIGKWGLGYPGSEGDPNNQGFDYFYGYNCQRIAHSYYPPHLWKNQEKVVLKGNQAKQKKQYTHDMFADDSLRFIKENKDKPFFLYLPFTIPHTKFEIPDLGQYKDKGWDKNHMIQAAMITRMDKDVGRIMDLLKELKIDDNTLLIFASDNGAHGQGGTGKKFNASGPLKGQKRSLYDGGIRVPMIARWPGKIEAGSESAHISGFQDMLPTFAELASVDAPTGIDGISMAPTLLGKDSQKKHKYLYWEFYEGGGKRAIRMGKWKAVQNKMASNPNAPIEIYNLENDLGETKNLASSKPELVATVKQYFKEARTPSDLFKFAWEGGQTGQTEEKKTKKNKKGKKKNKKKKS